VGWLASNPIPTIQFPQGTAGTYSLLPHTENFNTSLHQITLTSGSLPTGVTLNATSGYAYNGTGASSSSAGVVLTIVDNATGDWALRSGAAGVTHAQNFSTFSTAAEVYNFYNVGAMVGSFANKTPAMGATFTNAAEIITTPGHMASGKALRLTYGKNNYGTATVNNDYQTWCIPMNGNGNAIPGQYPTGAYLRKVYVQVSFWVDSFIDYFWRLADGQSGGSKFFIIDDYNKTSSTGELVITDGNNQQFIRAYRIVAGGGEFGQGGGSVGIERTRATPGNNINIQRQNAIDRGTALTDENSYQRRYGPMYTGMTGGTSQASKLSTQGVPDPDSAIGGIAINRGGITVVEVELDLLADRCRVWQAHHGDAPVLTHDTAITGTGGFGTRAGTGVGVGSFGWSGVSLTNLIHTAIAATNPNYPTDAYTDYSELIFSQLPINFPGGQAPPGV